MGNRANVCIREGEDKIYLYTHWGGDSLCIKVYKAMKKKWRWDDPPYLARIIFDEMTKNRHGEEGGYGIWNSAGDNNSHPIIVIDTEQGKIFFEDPENHNTYGHDDKHNYSSSWTFEEFINLDIEEVNWSVRAGCE